MRVVQGAGRPLDFANCHYASNGETPMMPSPSKRSWSARVSCDVADNRTVASTIFPFCHILAATQQRWGLLLPLVFASNVLVATLAWIIVGMVID
jgi:hypothetical protein